MTKPVRRLDHLDAAFGLDPQRQREMGVRLWWLPLAGAFIACTTIVVVWGLLDLPLAGSFWLATMPGLAIMLATACFYSGVLYAYRLSQIDRKSRVPGLDWFDVRRGIFDEVG